MSIATPQFARCRICGYRRLNSGHARCTECGATAPPIEPLQPREVRTILLRYVFACVASWGLMPLMSCLGLLAIATNSIGLFVVAAMLLPLATLVAFILTIVIALAWLKPAMHVLWSLRQSEYGPWSGWTRHAVVLLGMFALQLLGSALTAFASWSFFPGYPAGWP